MQALTERDIRASFVNCTKGEASRLPVPRDLATRPWDDLDFLGWPDPVSPQRAYLVAASGDGLVGVALRLGAGPPGAGPGRMGSPGAARAARRARPAQHVLAVPDHAHRRRRRTDDRTQSGAKRAARQLGG